MRHANRVPSPALALALVLAAVVLAPAASASHTAPPSSVALVGNLQSELGCPGDWQPDCPATELVFNGSRWEATFAVPAGNWEFKVALNDSWNENYGADGQQNGANIGLALAAPRNVRFSYDPATHRITNDAPLVQPSAVTIAGNLQSELGCPGDWQPECTATQLWLEPADQVWQGVFTVPAGNWEYKAPLNGSWDENYGANATRNGPNLPLNLASQQVVKFFYDHATKWVTSNRNAVIATVPGSYQSELGCPGDWQPDCLRSWLQDPDGDGLYSFETTALPAGSYEAKVAHDEAWNENYGANGVRNGANIPFTVSSAGERVVFTYDPATHVLTIGGDGPKGNLREARAHWLAEDTIAWNLPAGASARLHFSADGDLEIRPAGVTGGSSIALVRDGVVGGALAQKFRHLAGLPVFRIPEAELYRVPAILKQQFAVAALDAAARPLDATGLQPAGVLDQLYATDRPLGVTFDGATPTLRVWAPTARSVKLRLYDSPSDATAQVLPMQWDWLSGTWSLRGAPDWNRKYYLYEVEVFVRATGEVETNRVTDPYSLGLSMDSRRSQIVNLDDPDLKPRNWDTLRKPRLAAPEDIALYELHVRDFSIGDATVPAGLRGTFAAFGLPQSHGAKHLRRLATAGLTHVHLLPAFDCATIPEDRAQQQRTGDLSGFAPDSDAQQAAVEAVRERDGFNWCYDPFHYTTPEGSYATDADGVARIREFREMVAGLAGLGLRVVMDVVYNHTSASGQDPKSVLDRIVPGYYHRLNAAGQVENSTCCANTATEHAMMERLMVDSLVTWAKAYKVDGFRFDLMGHHSKANLLKVRDTLRALTPASDGVDGRAIYLYGEGWNFGEVSNDARFVQATQVNMGDGTGVGSFNDRLRDAVRGGGPFDSGADHVRRQGFANGLFVDPNAMNSGSWGERDELLRLSDWVRVGLAGSLRDFRFTDRFGNWVRGGDVDYGGQGGAGYTSDPQEVINYVEAHDNETLFDINQYKLPLDASPRERVRAANLATSIVALSQGVPFFHAGQDLLRSKSFDRNSYDSGDWFNVLDFSGTINGWGRGLPPERDNLGNWPYARPRLANPALAVGGKEIHLAAEHLREMLRIRNSSPLFRLQTGAQVADSLRFHNTGSGQVPGLIVMTLGPAGSAQIVVVFNADPEARQYAFAPGGRYALHPVQQESIDPVVRTARYDAATRTFSVPGRTTAVFVAAP